MALDDLNGRVAVVTGGGSGIGRGIALGLGAEGMTVAVADVRAASAEAVAAEVEAAGGQAFALGVDVTSVDSLEVAAKEVIRRAGGVNLLCANAGVLARLGSLADHGIDDWEYTFSVNVLGIVKTVEAFRAALLDAAPDAHVLTTASLGGIASEVRAPIGAYIASKYACVGYSEMLRGELERFGIGVSVLCPGVVTSNLMGTSAENRPSEFGPSSSPRPSAVESVADDAARLADFALPAEAVGPIVVRAIRANRFHVITHPDTKRLVEDRFRGMLDDFDFAAAAQAARGGKD